MLTRQLLVTLGAVLVTIVVAPATAWSQSPPTCAQMGADPGNGLAGNPAVLSHTATLVPAGGNVSIPYCLIDFAVSERGGPTFGYAAGEVQRIGLRIGLPANTSDNGTDGGPGGEGAWNGKIRNLGGGGLVGSLNPVTVATNTRYVGSFTDSGHTGPSPAFGVIQETNELNLGKIEDFFSESLRLQYQWALRLANTYYRSPPVRNYWDGCSTGGRQGLVLAAKHGQDFDGFLIGAPHTNHTRTSSAVSWREWVNQEIAGGTVTPNKSTAVINRMIAECDGLDGVVDGLLSDPRACKLSAAINMCGQPGAPTDGSCLNAAEAQAIDMVLDGARNDLGQRLFVPYGRGAAAGMVVGASGPNGNGANGVFAWANKDLTYDFRTRPLSEWDDLHQLATTDVGPYVDMRSPDLDLTRDRGGKILMWHGLADQFIPWQQNVYYYNQVVDRYQGFEHVTPWFRFFLAPGVTHCGGGVGPQPLNLFNLMVDWVENGVVPDSILSSGGGRTRPLCPFPQTAIYDGEGNPNVATSFQCGGNLETREVKCDGLLVKYQRETGTAYESVGGVDAVSCGFQFRPVTTAALSPRAVRNWYIQPTVALTATDQDSDVKQSEYRLDGVGEWSRYDGPFLVSGDGSHTLEYRSVDHAENVEATHSLDFKIDATAPLISGMPALPCIVWPANNRLVEVAVVTATDHGSGVVDRSLSIHVTSNERLQRSDVVIKNGQVLVRAQRAPNGTGRVYTIAAAVRDAAGNLTTEAASCTVPAGRRR
jgi:hypothetical protein